MILTLDLETTGPTSPEIIQLVSEYVKPPKALKKPSSIAEWERDERKQAVEDALANCSLDGSFGSIVCVGWAFDSDPPQSICHGNEHALLTEFCKRLEDGIAERALPSSTHKISKVIGHDVLRFDLRFLYQRLIINRIPLPSSLPFGAEKWSDRIGDTLTLWQPDPQKKISLDKLCRILGIESPKKGMDGSKVGEYARAGLYDEIASYCRDDVEAARACYQRMTG